MANRSIAKCASCGYPIKAEFVGQQVSCPFCSTLNEAIAGVTINTTVFWSALSFIAGIALGPYMMRKAAKYGG